MDALYYWVQLELEPSRKFETGVSWDFQTRMGKSTLLIPSLGLHSTEPNPPRAECGNHGSHLLDLL